MEEKINVDNVFEDLEFSNRRKEKKNTFDAKNYLDTHLKDGEKQRKIQIRILPVQAGTDKITLPVYVHSMKVNKEVSKSGFKTFLCLEDRHLKDANPQGCPICQKSRQLFKEANACTDAESDKKKTLIKEAYKLEPKVTYIVRVIERGKEEDGVKFWRFNKYSDNTGCFDKLKSLYEQRNQESIADGNGEYNIFDLHNGKDIILTISKGENTDVTKIDIIDCGSQKPLSKDENLIQEWVNDSKCWKDMYSSKPYEYLGIIAEGGIPYYDREQGKFVNKEDVVTDDDMENHDFEFDSEYTPDVR